MSSVLRRDEKLEEKKLLIMGLQHHPTWFLAYLIQVFRLDVWLLMWVR